MSADNYGVIKHCGEEFVVGFFFMSIDYTKEEIEEEFVLTDARFDSLYDAVCFAQEEQFEYGWTYSPDLIKEIDAAMNNHPARIQEVWKNG